MKEFKLRILTEEEYWKYASSILKYAGEAITAVGCWLQTTKHTWNVAYLVRHSSCSGKPYVVVEEQSPTNSADVLPVAEFDEPAGNVGDLLELFDHKWLMLSPTLAICKNNIGSVVFQTTTQETPDYQTSEVKRYLELWMNRVKAPEQEPEYIYKRFEGSGFDVKEVTLLTLDQFHSARKLLNGTLQPKYRSVDYWWLKTPEGDDMVYGVDVCLIEEEFYDDVVTLDTDCIMAVRPALVLGDTNGMTAGDSFEAGEYSWTYLGCLDGENIALCDVSVDEMTFFEEYDDKVPRLHPADYEGSDIELFLSEWAGEETKPGPQKVYRWMSPTELLKYMDGEEICPRETHADFAYTNGAGVFFLPENIYETAGKKDPYYKLKGFRNPLYSWRFMIGVVAPDTVLVEFEVLSVEGRKKAIGMYADPKTALFSDDDPLYWRKVEVDEVCFPSYSQKNLKATRFYAWNWEVQQTGDWYDASIKE